MGWCSQHRVRSIDFRTTGTAAANTEISDHFIITDVLEHETDSRIKARLLTLVTTGSIKPGGDRADADQSLWCHAEASPQTTVFSGEFQIIFTGLFITVPNTVFWPAQLDNAGHFG